MAPERILKWMVIQNEKNAFVRTLCFVSATMASMCFVGVGIILTILYETKLGVWKDVAYFGAMSVFLFAATSVFALILLYPKLKAAKKEKTQLLKLTVGMFVAGWIFFFILISALIWALSA